MQNPTLKFFVKLILVGLAVYGCSWFSLNYARELGRVSALWPANAVVVAVLLNEHRMRRLIPILLVGFVANFIPRMAISDIIPLILSIGMINMLECVICIGLLRLFVPRRFDMTNIRHMLWFGVSAIAAPAIVGGAVAYLVDYYGQGKFADSWMVWFVSHSLGLTIFTSLLVIIRPKELLNICQESCWKTGLAFAGIIATVGLVFWQSSYPILFLPIAALVVAAFYLDVVGAALCIFITTVVAIIATTHGHGPLALVKGSLTERVWIMQLFIAVSGLMTLPVAVVVSQRQKLQKSLMIAREIADKANLAKSDFLTSMSHELRTPMNSILGFAQMLQLDDKNHLNEKEKHYVEYILSGGNYLLKLINDVLDLARIEAGRFEMKFQSIGCRDLISSMLLTLQPLAGKRNITLETEFNNSVPALEADPDRIMQVLINLGSNAIKYTHEGSAVRIKVTPRDSMVRITISDTGPGIPAQRQKEIFQPFNRLGAEKGKVEGTGIGLVIAKRLIEAMHGAIGFDSTENGTNFWVELPNATSLFKSDRHFEKVEKIQRKNINASILYLEDSHANSFLMAQLLKDFLGVEIEVASTVADAISLSQQHRYDLVLSDIHLPDGTGFDFLKALRDTPQTADIPVIAVTADATEATRDHIKEAGFDAYYTKPFQVAHVVGSIRKLLGK